MLNRISYGVVFAVLAFGFYKSSHFTLIVAGIALFMLGMIFMEGGFKAFSGGILESILKRTTSNLPKSILSGFVSTTMVQSSSLISVIAISFLSAELLGLREAIGIIFGSNIGSTTTAWLVSAFGLKIKISAYALPMLVFGVVLKFTKSKSGQGVGSVLLGLGLLFMGIADMMDGFEAIKESINLAQFAMTGFLGLMVYIAVGIFATVVIQSSGATMAIVIAALASGQVTYENALALAIGSNVGTTITAILGSLTSNENGKRLAAAHLAFNLQTGLVAIIFLYPLISLTDWTAGVLAIAPDDYAMKLALFHTIFNLLGVVIMVPLVDPLVNFLSVRFKKVKEVVDKPLYLNNDFIKIPSAAISALTKETIHLLENAYVILAHGINVHRKDIYSNKAFDAVVTASAKPLPIDIKEAYQERIKSLYSEIVYYASHSQDFMSENDKQHIHDITIANRSIVEAIKDIHLIQENVTKYADHENSYIRDEYNKLRTHLVKILREIHRFKNEQNRDLAQLEMMKVELKEFDIINSANFLSLVKDDKINNKMATSLMNDASYASDIAENLIHAADLLWFKEGADGRLALDAAEVNQIIEG
jgi:phosphate:Na+ symporter